MSNLLEINSDNESEFQRKAMRESWRTCSLVPDQVRLVASLLANVSRINQCIALYDSYINQSGVEIILGDSGTLAPEVHEMFQSAIALYARRIIESIFTYGFAIITYFLPSDDIVPTPIVLDVKDHLVQRVICLNRPPFYRIGLKANNYFGMHTPANSIYSKEGFLLYGKVLEINMPDSSGNLTSPLRNLLSSVSFSTAMQTLVLSAVKLMSSPPIVTEEVAQTNTAKGAVYAQDTTFMGETSNLEQGEEKASDIEKMIKQSELHDLHRLLQSHAGPPDNEYRSFVLYRHNYGGSDTKKDIYVDPLTGLPTYNHISRYPVEYPIITIPPGRRLAQPPRVTTFNDFTEIYAQADREVMRAMHIPEGMLSPVRQTVAFNANFQTMFFTEVQKLARCVSACSEYFFNHALFPHNVRAAEKEAQKRIKAYNLPKITDEERTKLLAAHIKHLSRVTVKVNTTQDISTIMLLYKDGFLKPEFAVHYISKTLGIPPAYLQEPPTPPLAEAAGQGGDRVPDNAFGNKNLAKIDFTGPSAVQPRAQNFDTQKSKPDPTKNN